MKIQKTYKISGPLNDIHKTLVDLHQYGRLHPLINGVEKTPSSNQEITNYKITEQPFLWLPINIQYFAAVKANTPKVSYEVTGLPLAQAWIDYDLKWIDYDLKTLKNQEVEITFNLKIAGYLPGKKILQYKMVKAQDDLMEAMQAEFLGV